MENLNCNEEIFKDYKELMKKQLHLLFPQIQKNEMERAIDNSIKKRIMNSNCNLINSYNNITYQTNLFDITRAILIEKPILASYGALFKRHGKEINPLYKLIGEFAEIRNNYKQKMLKYPKGSELYKRYDREQKLAKVDTNAIYGSIGSNKSVFYNLYIATSITRQGRSYISASIMLFESLLANNIKFGSLDEIMMFIHNVIEDSKSYQFNDMDVLDEDISIEKLFDKLMDGCGHNWFPSPDECEIVWQIVNRLPQHIINRLYYKNNIYEFFDNKFPLSVINDILSSLESPFIDPNDPPDIIKEKLNLVTVLIEEFVYYKYQIIDKVERVETLKRKIDTITDTDSCIISLYPWYAYIAGKIQSSRLPIRKYEIDAARLLQQKNLNETKDIRKESSMEYIYDFHNNTLVERKRKQNPLSLIPEDAVRHSIINILAYTISKLLRNYFDRISIINNVTNESHSINLMSMKNEFLFSKSLLSNAKKHYSTIVEVQEGHEIPNSPSKRLNVKGMAFDTSTVPESTKTNLSNLLYYDILNVENIDQAKILNKLAVLEYRIKENIKEGKKDYFKPVKIKPFGFYKNPMSTQQVKASIVYNYFKDKNEPIIDVDSNTSVLVIKTKIDLDILERSNLKLSNPEKYELIQDTFVNNSFIPIDLSTSGNSMDVTLFDSDKTAPSKREISSIAIPSNYKTPKWLMEFIDYDSIVKENIGTFPLDSIGITKFGTNSAYSGIINL